MKLFCTASNSDIVNECVVYFGFKLPSEIIPTRIEKIMSKLYNVVETYFDNMLVFCVYIFSIVCFVFFYSTPAFYGILKIDH